MLTWHITRGNGEGTLFEVGGERSVFRFTAMDRDSAEQLGDLKHGDWLMDGKRLAFHREPGSFGIAFGERYWLWQRERRVPPGDGFYPGVGKETKRRIEEWFAGLPIKAATERSDAA